MCIKTNYVMICTYYSKALQLDLIFRVDRVQSSDNKTESVVPKHTLNEIWAFYIYYIFNTKIVKIKPESTVLIIPIILIII